MKPQECTLVLGIDRHHLEELRWTWPTWMHFKPELRSMPIIVFYDAQEVIPRNAAFLDDHPRVRWLPWEFPPAENQREKMISGFVHIPAREVETPWYLKLDTDTVATGPGDWIMQEWFGADGAGREPVLVASSWGYSKPADVIHRLDDWGDTVPDLALHPRLNLPPPRSPDRICHPRFSSWIFFGRTDWTRRVAGWSTSTGKLPCPSQDTYMFYCARREGSYTVSKRMARFNWKHTRLRKIREIVRVLGIAPAAH